jgi:hypothetical protein
MHGDARRVARHATGFDGTTDDLLLDIIESAILDVLARIGGKRPVSTVSLACRGALMMLTASTGNGVIRLPTMVAAREASFS